MNDSNDVVGAGLFWVPDSATYRQGSGILKWVHKSGRKSLVLETLGLRGSATIENAIADNFGGRETFPLLHGAFHGKPVTLMNVRQIGYHASLPGYATVKYSPDFVILGAHLSLSAADYPIGVSIQIDNLLDFLGSRRATVVFPGVPEQLHGTAINHTYPRAYEWDLPQIKIELQGDFSTQRDNSTVSLTEYAYFRATSESGIPIWHWYSNTILPLLRLVRFASSAPLPLGMVNLHYAEGSGDQDRFPSDRFQSEILINLPEIVPSSSASTTTPNWLFKAADLNAEILDAFLTTEFLDTPLHARLFEIENLNLSWNETLFQIVRLLESRHRHLYPVNEEKVTTHEERVFKIMELVRQTSNADAKLIKRGLRYAYEPSLQKRLHELTKHWHVNIQNSLPNDVKLGSLLGKIAEHRNFLAHGLPSDTPPLSGHELRSACVLLMIIIRLQILSEVGFDHKQSWKLITTTDFFHGWLNLLARPTD